MVKNPQRVGWYEENTMKYRKWVRGAKHFEGELLRKLSPFLPIKSTEKPKAFSKEATSSTAWKICHSATMVREESRAWQWYNTQVPCLMVQHADVMSVRRSNNILWLCSPLCAY